MNIYERRQINRNNVYKYFHNYHKYICAIVSYGVTFITEPHPLSEDRKCDCHIIEYNDNERW